MLVAAAAAVLALAVPAAASGAVRYVASGGTDAGDCANADFPCATIGYAVEQAAPSDTVEVGAGTYHESVLVDKPLTVQGPYANVDARGRTASDPNQAIIVPESTEAITVTADFATINGLTFSTGTGVTIVGAQGTHVIDSLFLNGVGGVSLASDAQTTIDGNQFTNMTAAVAGPVGGTELTITNNASTGSADAAVSLIGYETVEVAGLDSSGDQNGIAIANSSNLVLGLSTITDVTGSAFTLQGVTSAQVAQSTITGGQRGVWLTGGESTLVQVDGNAITGTQAGVQIDDGALNDDPTIVMNRIVGNATGIANAADVTVHANDNWWGCNEGPGQPGCDGVSNTGTGSIDADPWIVLDATAATPVVAPGATSAINASLDQNSDGDEVLGAVPDGTVARFTAKVGSVAPPTAATSTGIAQSTFTAGPPGPARVYVRVDNERVFATLTVGGPVLGPAAFDFGSVENGSTSQRQKFKVVVYGPDPVTFGTASISGPDAADFSIVPGTDTCSGQTVAGGDSCAVKIRFAPPGPTTGPRSATLTIPPTSGDALTSALSGTSTGSPTIKIAPASFSWGSIAVGAASPMQKFTIANYGNANLVVGTLTITGPDADQFEIVASTDGCSGQTVAPGSSCFLRLRFVPTTTGAQTAQLSVPSNAAGSATTSDLAGTGV